MRKVFKIENLDCANCAARLERALQKIDGVQDVTVNFMAEKIVLQAADADFERVSADMRTVCKKVEPECVIK